MVRAIENPVKDYEKRVERTRKAAEGLARHLSEIFAPNQIEVKPMQDGFHPNPAETGISGYIITLRGESQYHRATNLDKRIFGEFLHEKGASTIERILVACEVNPTNLDGPVNVQVIDQKVEPYVIEFIRGNQDYITAGDDQKSTKNKGRSRRRTGTINPKELLRQIGYDFSESLGF